jgi:hypothetical protein
MQYLFNLQLQYQDETKLQMACSLFSYIYMFCHLSTQFFTSGITKYKKNM